MINLSLYQKATALSLFYTRFVPIRFNRFANEVERMLGRLRIAVRLFLVDLAARAADRGGHFQS